MTISLAEKVKNLPHRPGVYLFKDVTGEIIYIGKAKDLLNRVGSYFHLNLDIHTKTVALVSRINDLDFIESGSEFEALVLEAELIKKYHPKYNIIQKDDKSYLYVVIKEEKLLVDGKHIKLPKILTQRKTELSAKDIVFGPYPDGASAKFIIKTLRKIFPFRDCSTNKFKTYQRRKKPCLYGQLKICPAPCIDSTSDNLKLYTKNIFNIKRILKGGSSPLVTAFEKEMKHYSALKNYERAAELRDVLKKFEYVRTRIRLPEKYIENPTLIDDLGEIALFEIAKIMRLDRANLNRIECYDISNISGKFAVGAMVVSEGGKINKKEYKKFKIKFKNTPDDFMMMTEVLSRRFSHLSTANTKVQKWIDPTLIIIDGGKGQVSVIHELMSRLEISIPLVGLAKKDEILIVKTGDSFEEVKIAKDNKGLQHIIALRDEAHRFGKKYHHELRSKGLIT